MKRNILFFLSVILLLSCNLNSHEKELDLKAFKITIPKNWVYIKEQGEDSFVGAIEISRNNGLSFDCSSHGYANHLIPTEEEFIEKEEWFQSECYFCKSGIDYTFKYDLKREMAEMKKKGHDSSLMKVEVYPEYEKKVLLPTAEQRKKYPKADYIAQLTHNNEEIYIPIEVPNEIKAHNILIDSNSKYVFKTIWPKIAGKGMTGIYIHSRTSGFNFQLNGRGLPARDQDLALKAFKTIKISQ